MQQPLACYEHEAAPIGRSFCAYDAPVPARRCCPRCPPDNTFLEYLWTRVSVVQGDVYGDFVPAGQPQLLFLHDFKCVECGYKPELTALSEDPDDAVLSSDDLGIPIFGSVLGI